MIIEYVHHLISDLSCKMEETKLWVFFKKQNVGYVFVFVCFVWVLFVCLFGVGFFFWGVGG